MEDWPPKSADDGRRYGPAAMRNRAPILKVLQALLPETGVLLEIASGTGEHAAYLAPHFPAWRWMPSDIDPGHLKSIEAWRAVEAVANMLPARTIDVTVPSWPDAVPEAPIDAVFNANMVHISPWQTCLGLLAGAGHLLRPGGLLCLYGPFISADRETAPSNLAFDRSLRQQDSRWGVRRLEDIAAAAEPHGLDLEQRIDMPSNNLTVVLRRR